ncbi:MAG: hypothetical protein AVDCRST_MAG14-634, partial [uncultured Rubrobacteraceae bacterium]
PRTNKRSDPGSRLRHPRRGRPGPSSLGRVRLRL